MLCVTFFFFFFKHSGYSRIWTQQGKSRSTESSQEATRVDQARNDGALTSTGKSSAIEKNLMIIRWKKVTERKGSRCLDPGLIK